MTCCNEPTVTCRSHSRLQLFRVVCGEQLRIVASSAAGLARDRWWTSTSASLSLWFAHDRMLGGGWALNLLLVFHQSSAPAPAAASTDSDGAQTESKTSNESQFDAEMTKARKGSLASCTIETAWFYDADNEWFDFQLTARIGLSSSIC